jgi:hypothetical protein
LEIFKEYCQPLLRIGSFRESKRPKRIYTTVIGINGYKKIPT